MNTDNINSQAAGTPPPRGGWGRLHAFDFDGTLTRRDTLLEFIRYVKGNKEFLLGFLKHLHLLLLMKIGIMPNWKTKRIIFQYFFGGMTLEKFNEYAEKFARDKASLLRKKGMAAVNKALMDGDEVVIISASIENWVAPFFSQTSPQGGTQGGLHVIGTKVQVVDGKLKGRFLTKNCYGEEKVRRLLEQYPNRKEYELVAYGDSRGDHPLLDFADEGHYREF